MRPDRLGQVTLRGQGAGIVTPTTRCPTFPNEALMRTRSVCLALLAVGSGSAAAQTVSPEPGARIRVLFTPDPSVASSAEAIGMLVVRTDSSLVVDRGRRVVDTISQSRIRRIDVAIGHRSLGGNVLRGSWIGGAIVGGVGLIVGAALHDGYSCYDGGFCVSAGDGAVIGGVLGMAGGAVIGLMSGSTTRWQHGQPVVRVTMAPARDGAVMVGLSISH